MSAAVRMSDDAVIVTHICGHQAVCNPEHHTEAAGHWCLPCAMYTASGDATVYVKMLIAQEADVADCREKDQKTA